MGKLLAGWLGGFSVVVLAGVQPAFATSYTWTGGGTAGQWTDSANWGVTEGSPGAGDIANFSTSATITEDIVIGAGMLVISNAADTALHLNCVVSGQGGIDKGGAGSLHLYKDNTFEGKFVSTGTIDAKNGGSGAHTSCVMIYSGGALGRTAAEFDQDYVAGHGSELFINGAVNSISDFVVTVPVLKLTGDAIQSGNCNISNCTSVTFKGDVSSRQRFNIESGLATLVFEKSAVCPHYNINPAYTTVHYYGPVTNGTFYMSASSYVTLHTNGNVWTSSAEVRKQLTLGAENALDPDHALSFADNNTVIDINGFDQTYRGPKWTVTRSGCAISTPTDKPATLRFTGAVATQPQFVADMKGPISFEWSPSNAAREFVFSNVFLTASGAFSVNSGTLRFKSGAGFLGLSSLSVASGATFSADASAATALASSALVVESGGTFRLASGITYSCKSCTFGSDVLTDGSYTHEDYPDFIDGDGTLVVASASDMVVWTGANGRDWFDPANWDGGRIPAAGDTVLVGGGSMTITNATPVLGKFTSLGATVEFSGGWNTCLEASEISFANSTVTCSGPFTNDLQKTRVHIRCGTLVLDAKSVIDMDAKGWKGGFYDVSGGGNNPSATVMGPDGNVYGGWGPGRVIGNYLCAASHIGLGGASGIVERQPSRTYDDPLAPTEPGSGGRRLTASAYGRAYTDIGSGGGAVFIEATGAVTIDGAIRASGGNASTHSYYSGNAYANTPGSGGSVRIVCETISGSGTIAANGGNGNDDVGAPSAGGGGVAIVCDDSKQVAGACAGMKISAAEGVCSAGNHTTYATADNYWRTAEPGTVYLSSMKIVEDTIGRGLSGRLVGVKDYTRNGDLSFTWGHLRLCETGVTFTVTGNLTLLGGNARLDLGGHHSVTNRGRRYWVDAGDELVKLSVGGNLSVSGGSALAVYAAKVDGETEWGAEVSVGGAFTVGDGGIVYPTSNYGYGGAPHFTAASFTLASDGLVNGKGRGGSGAWNNADYTQRYGSTLYGVGIGRGYDMGGGAGHGGAGGKGLYNGTASTGTAGSAHDDPYLPCQSGSGGGSGGFKAAEDGGGVFHLVCTGPVQIDGAINMDANSHLTDKNVYIGYYSTGSGGTICIVGSTISGAAALSARGGDASYGGSVNNKGVETIITSAACGLGAGGRVSLWSGGQYFGLRGSKARHSLTASDEALLGGFAGWTGTVDVTGGTNILQTSTAPITSNLGEDGTVWFNAATRPFGFMLNLR